MAAPEQIETRPSPAAAILRGALLGAFGIAAVLVAYLTYVYTRDLVAGWQLTSLPGVSITDATPTPGGTPGAVPVSDVNTPLQPMGGPTPPAWDGAKRVTVLIMGLDARDIGQSGPPRTDSMMLLTIDPVNQTAGMLSIPRDLWVDIPGFNYGRINTAYPLGEAYKIPGGGPGLAMKTVEELLGVPIDYYAQIDFDTFVKFVDDIGGVRVNIPKAIKVDPLGKGNTKTLKPGWQVLDGYLALAYARARHTDGGDFDRAARQQQVIIGIRDHIMKLNMLPTLIAKSGTLYNDLSSGIHTNLTLDEVIRLAWLASQIKDENIKKGIISPPDQVTLAQSPDGSQEVLKPITDKIRLLRDEVFNSGAVSPAAASMDPAQLMKAEAARVSVLNGSATAGLAAKTMSFLQEKGVNVTASGNATAATAVTQITFYNAKPYTVKFLMDLLGINNPLRIHYVNNPKITDVDVVITLGNDWASKNPMQ